MIPDKLYLGVNLPSTFKGEFSIGTAVITLTQFGRKTVVNCTLSRQYRWTLEGPNPMREIRQSEKFRESTRVTWEDKFLVRLRELAENDEVDP
jgi:hypothetical protein